MTVPTGNATRPTPACAGITPQKRRSTTPGWAYPRVRGDHRAGHVDLLRGGGLPPRARKSQLVRAMPLAMLGPTPACAGITSPLIRCGLAAWAYPRVRGDHQACHRWGTSRQGLPPRARGSPRRCSRRDSRRRPTPACAGITPPNPPRHIHRRAYPRVRGDHPDPDAILLDHYGLPPRARGSPTLGYKCLISGRPTPACAGIT